MDEELKTYYAVYELLLQNAEDEDYDYNLLHQTWAELLENVEANHYSYHLDEDIEASEELIKKLNQFKADQDFYDAEGELDFLFPNRADEEDDGSSYENFFGKD